MQRKGYTLLETLISMLLFSVVFTVVLDFSIATAKRFNERKGSFSVYSDSELGLILFGKIVRAAGSLTGDKGSIDAQEKKIIVLVGEKECRILDIFGFKRLKVERGCTDKGRILYINGNYYEVISEEKGIVDVYPELFPDVLPEGKAVSLKKYEFYFKKNVLYLKVGNSTPQKIIDGLKDIEFSYSKKILTVKGEYTNGRELEFYVFTPFIGEV